MVQVIGIPNCDTIRKTKKLLSETGVSYSFRDVKTDPLSRDELTELTELVVRAGIDTLVNHKGRTWRSLGLADKALSDNDLFEILLDHQTMIKRPVLRRGNDVMIGFDEAALLHFAREET